MGIPDGHRGPPVDSDNNAPVVVATEVGVSTAIAPLEPPLAEPAPADQNPARVYLARLAGGGRRTMRRALDQIAGMISGGACDADALAWDRVGYQHAAAVRSALIARLAPATVNKMLAAMRGVLRETWRLGKMSAEQCQRACDAPGAPGTPPPTGRALAIGELRALLAECVADASPAGARDAAILAVGFGAGLRRAEIAALDVDDWRPEPGELLVKRGKGANARIAYPAQGVAAALADWLAVRGAEPGAMFPPILKNGRILPRRLSEQSVYDVMTKRAGRAGVAAFSPHDMRRTFISALFDAGADASAIQRLAGHSGIATTIRYDRRPSAAQRSAAALLHLPYGGRGAARARSPL
jgi:integrase